MKVYAPGKLILSGEHSVVYGQPALAMAVNRYATATISRELLPQISFHLSDLAHRSRLSFGNLQDLKKRLKQKYQRFMRGEYTIRQVLHKPFELAQVAFSIFAESFNFSLPHGVKIHVQSDIPIGCGMGSSAATILCVMHAVAKYLKVPISDETLYQLALEAENLQHGQSSGLDLKVAMQGGCVYIADNALQARSLPELPMYLINTGTPESSTGECVQHAASFFKSNQLSDDFANVTNAMDVALQQQAYSKAQEAIRYNHQLLSAIEVVPKKVQAFITDMEQVGGAGKICGSGAVRGDQGGAVLVMIEDKTHLNDMCEKYGYELISIAGESRGVYAL